MGRISGLVKDILDLIKNVLIILFAFKTGKFLKQAFLLSGQVGRCYHFDNHMLITTSTAVHHWHTYAFEAERTVTLGASRNLEHGCLPIHDGHLDLVAKCCLCEADREFVD